MCFKNNLIINEILSGKKHYYRCHRRLAISNILISNTVIYVFLLLRLIYSYRMYVSSSCQLALFGFPKFLFRAFSSVVRQMPGYTMKRRGKAQTLPKYLCYIYTYIFFVLYRSLYCLCVNVYCTTATGCQPSCS